MNEVTFKYCKLSETVKSYSHWIDLQPKLYVGWNSTILFRSNKTSVSDVHAQRY